jgi:large repetitive protein
MSRNGGERLASLLTGGKAAGEPQSLAVHSSTIRDLVDGSIVLERASDDTVILVAPDGTRQQLSPEQTADLALALLRASTENGGDHDLLIRLHSITAARSFVMEAEEPQWRPGPSVLIAEMRDGNADPVMPQRLDPLIDPQGNPGIDIPQPEFRSIQGLQNPDNAQFRTGYNTGFIGPGRGHLDGLPDEDLKFRNSFRRGLTILDISEQGTPLAGDIGDKPAVDGADQGAFAALQTGLLYETGFVGPSINHLAPLLNEDYRFGEIAPRELGGGRVDDLLRRQEPSPIPVPVQVLAISVLEDQPIGGTIFPDGIPSGGTIRDLVITDQPPIGTVTIDIDGNFTIAAPTHFSGLLVFTYSYFDGTGTERTTTVAVVVTPVVDAPSISAGIGAFTANEDSTLALSGLSAELVDRDGSETLTRIAIEGVPPGARFVDGSGSPLGTNTGSGVWTFRPGEIEQAHLVPDTHVAGVFNLTLRVTSTETANNQSTTVLAPFTVTFAPVADAPVVSVGSGAFLGTEDQSIALTSFTAGLVDSDGSETLVSVTIIQVPAGGSFVDGSGNPVGINVGGGIWSFTPAELTVLHFIAPLHVADIFDMQLIATSRETANGDTATSTLPFRVTTTPVADAPGVTVGAGAFSGEEDTRIALPGLSAALVDRDGSETMASVRITGVPPGSVFTDAGGTPVGADNGDGTWSFTATQLTGLQFLPPINLHGVFNLTLEAITRETATGDTATTTVPFTITVDAQADAPVVGVGSTTINEDTLTVIGAGISYGLVDQDGSEGITQVEITGFPGGASITLTAVGGATVTTIAGGYRITGSSADIRSTIDGLAVRAPGNSDVDIALTVAVTTTDADSSTATASNTYTLNVSAIADAPTVSGSASGNEDTVIAVPITVGLTDTDGSETLASVVVSQVPTGAVFGWNTGLPGSVVDNGDNSFTFTGTTAQIQALLLTVTVRPPANSDVDFNLRVTATSTESNPSGGQVTTLNAVTVFDIPVTVNAVADQPTINVTTSRGDEDAIITFGANITYSLVDADGSEAVSQVTLTGFPGGSTVSYTLSGAATVNLAAGIYTIAGTAADIRATLDSFVVQAPANSDANIALTVTVTSTDTGGVTATRTGSHTVIVDAVADAPTGSGSATGSEDTDIPLSITMANTDADGSETITYVKIEGVPTGGTLNWTNFTGATVVNLGGGTYTIAGTEAAIRNVLGTTTVRPPLNSDVDFSLTVTVRATETNPTTVGEVSLLNRETSFSLPVTVNAVADQPTVSNTSTNGTEDTTIVFGTNVTYSLFDTDGSESVTSVAVSGVPAGWTLAYTATGGGSVGLVTGVYTITGTQAAIRATLDTFRITPPLDDDADAVLTISVTITETGGLTATRNATHTVVVAADADTPVISVGTGTFNGTEDLPVALSGFTAAITDTDASAGRAVSEVLDVIRITGVPTGASFQNGSGTAVGTNAGGGIWTFTSAELATLRFLPPLNLSGTFNMALEAISRETSNSDLSTTATLPFSVTIGSVPDVPLVTTGTSTGVEDTTFNFGTAITYVKADNLDGSESISEVVISGVVAGWTVAFTATGGGLVNTGTPGTYRITGTEAGIRATLDTFTIRPPLDSDDDTSVQVTVTSQEASGGTATSSPQTHSIVVTAKADIPSVNVGAASFTTNEDTRVALASFAVGISDTDASAARPVSETISLVRITGVSVEAGTGFWNAATGGAAVGTNLGGGVWTFTPVQLASLFYNPGTNRSGTYNMVLEATARESSNLDTAVFSRNFTVNVTGVPDQLVIAPGSLIINEDALQSNMGNVFGVTLSDNDGSQTINMTITGFPTGAGAVVTFTAGTATVNYNGATGVLTLSGASDAVLIALNTLDIQAPTNSDVNLALNISATTTENGTTLSAVNGTLNVVVRAVADLPTISGSATTSEDVLVTVPVTVALTDTDGSETYNFVDVRLLAGMPVGTALTVTSVGGATVVYNGGTLTWRVTGSTSAIQQTLLSGVTVQSATNRGENITVQVQAESREAAVGGEVFTATSNTGWQNILVTVNDVADKPDVTVPSNQLIEEDTTLTLSGLGIVKVDTDGSEVFTLTLAGVPDGSSFGGKGTPGANVGGFRTWTFTEAEVTGLTFTPPLNLHGSWVITATTTARELENSDTKISDPKNFMITVDAQADAPTVTTTGATGNEDTSINFGTALSSPTTGITLFDTDGSERLFRITISGFPGGVVPTYSLVGTGAVGVALGVYTITGATEADIRATLATFAMTPPLHSDANIPLTVIATTIDADGSTAPSTTTTHTVVVRGVADQPTISTGATASGTEDTNIALSITTDRIDTDGSEVLSVRITLPAGITTGTIQGNTAGGGAITNQGGGVFLITAPTEAQLDAILSTVSFRPPANWSGTTTLTIEAIATETGPEIAVTTAINSSTIAITVGAIADIPVLKVVPSIGGASGYEDQPIRLSISVTLPDGDGSETYVVRLSGQPAGSVYTNAAGTPIGTNLGGGVWEFTPAQLAVAHIIPPLNSSNDFSIGVEAIITDTGPTGSSVVSVTGTLSINVIGVADQPTVVTPVTITSAEDQPIPLGANVIATLVDTDGSETLYYVISGLPVGIVPSRGTYIGGEWQISASDMPFVTIASPANFSGNYVTAFAPGLSVRAVTQENDGNEAVTNITVNITITPVIDSFSWSPSVTLAEESAITLSAAAFGGTLPDSDGSEQITSYTFNLNGIVAAAQIGGIVGSTANFITNYVTGPFTNNGNGTITVTAANMGLVSFSNTAFHDSNVNFTIPVSARIQESDGSFQIVNSTFAISIDGVADVPTVFAGSVSGTAGSLIALNPTGVQFGGVSTDTDVALGRSQSERIYYIVSGLQTNPAVELALTNSSGQIVGLDNGDGTWYLEPADLVGLQILTRPGSSGTVNMTLTTIAVENDSGSRAQSATNASFSVTVVPGGGGGGPMPLLPVVSIGLSSANEDGSILVNVNAQAAPGDPTNPTVTVLFSNVPAGFTLVGATFNPTTGRWIATAADVNAGLVSLRPPADWSGSLTGVNTMQVEAIAVNSFLNRVSTGLVAAPITVTPDADGPAFSANPAAGIEDQAIALNLSVTPRDTDASSPEFVVNPIVITVPAGTSLSAGTNMGGNVWNLTTAQLVGLSLVPPLNYHGPLAVTVQATTQDVNGDTQAGSTTLNLNVAARADIPNATASNVTGTEDTSIALTGLSASLVDTDGSEVLSVKISGVPVGAIFNAGGNNGDGTWTIPVAALATLSITPPPQYSGLINLTLIAYALETSNGNTNLRSVPFTVSVAPSADIVILDPLPLTTLEEASAVMPLRVLLDDRLATIPGENPPELVEITFTGLPAGASLSGAGTIINLGGGSWRFTGSETQANAITFVPPANYSGTFTVGMSAVSIDGASRLAVPATDSFLITVTPVADTPVLQTNTVRGNTGTALAFNLFAYSSDPDGSETVFVTVSNIPAGATFSAGTDLGGGSWRFTEAQLAGLTMTLAGGTTNTTLTVIATATETANGATATANSTISLVVGTGPNSVTGTTSSDLLTGGAGDDTFFGSLGGDTMNGALGTDTVDYTASNAAITVNLLSNVNTGGHAASDSLTSIENIIGSGFADAITGDTFANSITGGIGADTLSGGDNNDTLDGGVDADSLVGGLGNDVFLVDNVGDVVVEAAAAGTDEIRTTLNTQTIAALANIENLTFIGAGNFTGTGNTGANSITGGAGNDTLIGDLGNDTLVGGLGIDTASYAASNLAVIVNLLTNVNTGGHAAGDSITGVENVTGSNFADSITGNIFDNILLGGLLNDTLSGGDGNDTLDGGTGNDSLVGGLGNDVFIVDSATDTVVEAAAAGTDEIRTTLTTQTIAALTNIENLTYTGAGNFTGTGNTGANVITGGTGNDTLNGGDGNDTLDGGTGNDSLVGGLGNDVFIVDSATDTVVEAAAAGTDEIRTTLTTQTIAALTNIENLTYTGAGNFTGTGNTGTNVITGSTGNDSLNGGGGNDTLNGGDGNDTLDGSTGNDSMTGGLGNDIYIVDSATDVIVEAAASGTDEIRTTLTTQTIAALTNIENLTFTGAGNFTGTGNAVANSITGGTGNDTLTGSDGNDTLIGGTGNDSLLGGNDNDLIIGGQGADTLNGGAGVDTFRYLAGDVTAVDQIIGFTAGAGGDVIDLDLLIPGYDNNPLTLSNYVNLLESGGNTSVRIDTTGTSNFTTTVLSLQGVIGLDLNSLRTNGNLVT